jgi:tetratricopeptide (TPR) repeat protein
MLRISCVFALLALAGCNESSKGPSYNPKSQFKPRKSPLEFLKKGAGNSLPGHFSVDRIQELVASGDIEEASRYTNMALHISPQVPVLHLINGFLYEEIANLGNDSKRELATVAYQRAYELDPSQWLCCYLLGLRELRENKIESAQQRLADALILNPSDPDIAYALAYASYYLRDLPVAFSAINKALNSNSNDPSYLRAGAIIYGACNHTQRSEECLKKYQQIVGNNEPDVQVVQNRLADWKRFHNSRIQRVADDASAGEGVAGRGDPDASAFTQKQVSARGTPEGETIYVDAYLLRTSETTTATAGNNVMNTLALVLGSTSTNIAGSSTPSNLSVTRTLGRNAAGGPVTGSWTKMLTYSITPQAIAYSLNIANVSKQIVEVLARPSVATLVGKPAYFLQGDQYIGAAAGNSGSAIASVDAGTKVEITPLELTSDGILVMDITVTGSIFTAEPNTGASIQNQILQISRSKVMTTIKAFLGQTIILGGIYSREQTETRSGVPFLSDLPIIQYFFGQDTASGDTRAILYLITPRKGGMLKDCNFSLTSQGEGPASERLKDKGLLSIGEYPTLYYVVKNINRSPMFTNFRSGDLPKPFWGYDRVSITTKLDQLKSFLWF